MVKSIAQMLLSSLPAVLICGGSGLIVIADVLFCHGRCSEGGLVEICQFVAVLIASLLLLGLAVRHRHLRGGFTLVGAFFLDMAIREQDGVFDRVFHGFWVVPVLIITAAAFVIAWKSRKTMIPSLELVFRGRGFGSLSLGVFTVIGFSRLLGYKGIWKALGDYSYFHVAKRIAEESVELFGYMIILGWAIQFFFTLGHKEQTHD